MIGESGFNNCGSHDVLPYAYCCASSGGDLGRIYRPLCCNRGTMIVNFVIIHRLRFVSERADSCETIMAVALPERQGAFRELHSLLYPRTITEFSYRHNGSQVANIVVSFQALSGRSLEEDKVAIKESFESRDFQVTDLSENEMAKSHARHLAGGRRMNRQENDLEAEFSSSVDKDIPNPLDCEVTEFLYRFEFPEAPGALNAFFCSISLFNQGSRSISLLHYRNHGHDYGSVLVGLLVRSDDRPALLSFVANLGYEHYDETSNDAYTQFLR